MRVTAVLVAVVLLVGCGGGDGKKPGTSGAVTAGGAGGALARIRPIDADPKPALPATVIGNDKAESIVVALDRIVVMSPLAAEVVWSLGLGKKVVARDSAVVLPEATGVDQLPATRDLTLEKLAATKANLLLADQRLLSSSLALNLRATGMAVVMLPEAGNLTAMRPKVELIAAAVGLPADGAALLKRIDDEIAAAKLPAGTAPKVLYVRRQGPTSFLLGGKGSGVDGLIEAVGAVDAGSASGLTAYSRISAAAVQNAQPDAILISATDLAGIGGVTGVKALPGVAGTPVDATGKVIAIEDGLLTYGPRTPAALHRIVEGLTAP